MSTIWMYRVTAAVVADHGIVTGHAVTRGAPGCGPESDRVRAAYRPGALPPDRFGRSVVLDDWTDHDISRPGINDEEPAATGR